MAFLCLIVPAGAGAQTPGGRWIVQLAPGAQLEQVLTPARERLGVRPAHRFHNALRGFAATLTDGQRRELLRDPRVQAVVPDLPIRATFQPQQVQPGVKRVRSAENPDRSDAPLAIDIAVLDTGIQPDHPDLNVVGGYNCTNPAQPEGARQQPSAWRDGGFGHGTHVAGIAAAHDNGRGVVGVAPGARLWSVKVLDHDGLGYWSWIICGLDWVAARRDNADSSRPLIEVVNMSLAGGGTDDGNCGFTNADLLHRAICRVEREGVTIVAAAGNEATRTAGFVPAAYDEVIAVSALADYDGKPGGLAARPAGCAGADDAFAGFSNHGDDVDLIAPGVCVLSTLPGSRYGRISGTSMATPHVTGGAALYHLWEARMGRPRPKPQQVRAALLATGVLDWRTGTDGDRNLAGSVREPLLNVASFNLAATFRISVTPQTQRRVASETATYDVSIARLGGFSGAIDLTVSGLPAGAAWRVEPDPIGGEASGWRRIAIDLPASGPVGSHAVLIRATSGAVERSATVQLHFDGTQTPAARGPRLQLRSGVGSKIIALPARVTWDAVGGATRYQLQVSRDGGAWQQVDLPVNTATHFNRTAWPGSTYQHRVRAMRNGAWDAWAPGPTSFAVPRYAPYDGVDLTGNWSIAPSFNAYSELPVYSTQSGAQATLAFEGRSVSWLATRGPKRGRAHVLVDGALAATVDLYAGSTQFRRVVFSFSWREPGAHTIQIRVVGTSGRPRVDIDAVVVIKDG